STSAAASGGQSTCTCSAPSSWIVSLIATATFTGAGCVASWPLLTCDSVSRSLTSRVRRDEHVPARGCERRRAGPAQLRLHELAEQQLQRHFRREPADHRAACLIRS